MDVTSLKAVPGMELDGYYRYGHGVAFADVTGDGLPDLYVSNAAEGSAAFVDLLYINYNSPPYAFREDARARGLQDAYGIGSHGLVFFDMDNDGDYDVYNGNTYQEPYGHAYNRLYNNSGHGYFNDVTLTSGLSSADNGTRSVAAFDANNDGWMDLFSVGSRTLTYLPEAYCFYMNQGNGTYRSVDLGTFTLAEDGLGPNGLTIADYDNDGEQEIYISRVDRAQRGARPCNQLLDKQANGSYVNMAGALNVLGNGWSDGATFADFDNDGDLDLFVSSSDGYQLRKLNVYKNNGDGTFIDLTDSYSIYQRGFTSVLFDVDNDGDLDLYAISRDDAAQYNRLYLNDGKGNFQLVENTGLEVYYSDPRGAGVADIDNDGDLDIYVTDTNKVRDKIYSNHLFRNDLSNTNRWLKIKGRGPKGDAGAFGTKIWIFEKGHLDDLNHLIGHRQNISTFGFCSQSDPLQHFGLGQRDTVAVKIALTDGTTLKMARVAAGKTLYFSKPTVMEKYAGDNQTGAPRRALATPLQVLVRDARGVVVAGAPVNFESTDGFFVETQPVYTDHQGIARVNYIVANNANTQTVLVTMPQVAGQQSVFTVYTTIDPTMNNPRALRLISSAAPQGAFGWVLPDSVQVRVLLDNGAPAMGHTVQFQVQSGQGKLFPGDLTQLARTTNSNGYASVAWKMGSATSAMTQQLLVQSFFQNTALTGSPLTVTATVTKPDTLRLVRVSPQQTSGQAGAWAQDSIIVRVVNGKQIPVAGQTVIFKVLEGNGSLNASLHQEWQIATNQHGLAKAAWKQGTKAGQLNRVSVSATHYNGLALANSPLYFISTVSAAAGMTLSKISGDGQNGEADTVLADSIRVRVIDPYGNPHANVQVTFQVLTGGGNLAGSPIRTVFTNGYGEAAVAWTLADVSSNRSQTLGVFLPGHTAADAVFTAWLTRKPTRLQYVSGDGQSGIVGQTMPVSLTVRLQDAYQQPSAGFDILFKVIAGNGYVNGLAQQLLRTDENGLASAGLTLGAKANVDNMVIASYSGVDDTVRFTARSRVGAPTVLNKISDSDRQFGRASRLLAKPFQAIVTDPYANPIANHPITFTVTSSEGTINNQRELTLLTDHEGIAQVTLLLGAGSGVYSVSAVAQHNGLPLTNSPVVFTATTLSDPVALVLVSGDSTAGLINRQVTQPLRVRVTDAQGFPVPEHDVQFIVRRGGGNFDGVSLIKVVSNIDGIASVSPILGNTPGVFNNVFEAQSFAATSQHLRGSPVPFHVSAKKSTAEQLLMVSGNLQVGQVGQLLRKPLVVKAIDGSQEPVPGQDVRFTVVQGSGKLGNNPVSATTLKTDQFGLAQINFRLGEEIGQSKQHVRVEADNGVSALQNSPLLFTLSAMYGLADSLKSTVIASSPVIADGIHAAQVTVKLLDKFNNPVAGERVFLTADGDNNLFDQPTQPTDTAGITRGALRSTKVGVKWVRALVSDKNIFLAAKAQVEFIAGPAVRFVVTEGDHQTGVLNSVLEKPVVIQALDQFDNPTPNVQITLQPLTGCGRVEPATPLLTDSQGQISVKWILGPTLGNQYVQFSAVGAAANRVTALATAPSYLNLTRYKGDGQYAQPNNLFSDSLQVRVVNELQSPISGVPVFFTVTQGIATIVGNSLVNSDSYGLAGIRLQAGSALGNITVRAAIGDSVQTEFNESVTLNPPDRMITMYGDQISALVNTVVNSITVRVLDADNNAVAGVPITFTCQPSDAVVLAEQPVRTGNNGLAVVDIQLGKQSGPCYVMASSPGLHNSPLQMTLHALPGPARELVYYFGNAQEGRSGQYLLYPLKVRVVDAFQNGVSGISVQFSITSGNGRFSKDPTVLTDSTGIAAIFWQMGDSGLQNVSVVCEALPGQMVDFVARLIPNEPPVITAPADTSIIETNTLVMHIDAYDPEGGPVNLTMENLPPGAEFDSVNMHNLVWTPDMTQQGVYHLEIVAKDNNNAISRKTVTVHVLNLNRPPTIEVTPDTAFLAMHYYRRYAFSVTAQDPDGDILSYYWRIGNELVGREAGLVLIPNPTLPVHFGLVLTVKDGSDSVKYFWDLQTITFIELSSFTAVAKGVDYALHWSSSLQRNHQGFNVLRAVGRQANFTRINQELIPADKTGNYVYKETLPEFQQRVFYKLQAVSMDGAVQEFGPVECQAMLPTQTALLQNYPNPFNPETTISYEIAAPQEITITLYNLNGQRVRTLYSGPRAPGYFKVRWDGRDYDGKTVATGVYHCLLTAKEKRSVIKLLLLK